MKKIINRLTLILIMVVAVGLFGGTAEAEAEAEASVTVVVNANGSVTELPETDCSSDDYDRDEWGNHPTADPDATPTWTLPSDNVSSSDITNDHHVALKDAQVSGGCDWSAAMKNDFSSDSDNLNPTTRSFNSSKGSRTPDQLTGIAERIINTDDEKCDYATQHDAVKDEYDLSMTDIERSTVTLWLSFCQEGDGGSSPQPTTRPTMVSATYSDVSNTVTVTWVPDSDAQQHWVVLFSLPDYEHGGRVEVGGANADTVAFESVPPGRYEALVASYSKTTGFEYGDDTAFNLTVEPTATPTPRPTPGPTATPRPTTETVLDIEIDTCSSSGRSGYTLITIRGTIRAPRAVDDVVVYGSLNESYLPEYDSDLARVLLNVGFDEVGNIAAGQTLSYDVSYPHNGSLPRSAMCHVVVFYR